jgi:WD40 repeat protein
VAAQNTFGRPGTIRVVELATGRIVRVLKGHEDGVTSVALSPDAKWLASGSWDKSVRIWDLSGGVCEHVFRGHNGRVAFIAWMADGRTLVCGGYHSIYVWELETGACRVEIGVQIYGAHRGTLTPDESALICAGGYAPFRGTARFALSSYDLSTGAETGVWRGHTGAVSGLAIDRTGSVIVSGSEDSTVRVWSLADQQELSVYPTLAPVSAISNLTTDGRVAIGLATGEVQLLRLENSEGRRQGGFHVHPDPERDAL